MQEVKKNENQESEKEGRRSGDRSIGIRTTITGLYCISTLRKYDFVEDKYSNSDSSWLRCSLFLF